MSIDGPIFPIYDTDPSTGALLPTISVGVHYKVDPEAWSVSQDALASYRVHPPFLQNVWAGDDPVNPVTTIPLCFPDQATATSVLTACGLVQE